jgi:ribulose-5-phosphate 4-epimerase/fuculose-1-phosphate aldolase
MQLSVGVKTLTPSAALVQRFGEGEAKARLELAGLYRVFDMLGWTEMIYNHISLRVPGPADQRHFLINPFGLHYSEVCASNLVKVDLSGRIIGPSQWPINPAGFVPHATIHGALQGAHCVMHTHTTNGLAVACYEGGLAMNNFYSAQLFGKVAYHDFEGITLHADEGPRLLQSIGQKPAVILRNHGLLAWGDTLARTFAILWTLQRACDVQVATAALGAAIPLSEAVQQKCAADSLQFTAKFGAGQDVLDAMLRKVNRFDTSYQH